jgi:hypothetical protein
MIKPKYKPITMIVEIKMILIICYSPQASIRYRILNGPVVVRGAAVMSGPLPDQPGKAEPPVDQGDDLVLDPPRFPGAQEKTRMRPAGPVAGHASVRRNMV